MIDRLPPHDIAAEQGCLACIILDNAGLNVCVDKFKNQPEVFYDLRNRCIFEVMVGLHSQKLPIDTITLASALKNANQLELVGGMLYVSTLPDQTPNAANIDYYADIVFQKFLLRSYLKVCAETTSRIYDNEGDIDGLIGDVEKSIVDIGNKRYRKKFESAKSLVQRALQDFDLSITGQGKLSGIGSGMPDLDKLTWGFQDGDFIILAARPSIGKTSIALNWVDYIAIEQNVPVGIFSLEMTALALIKRMISSRALVNIRNILNASVSPADMNRMTEAASVISNAPLYIEDETRSTLPEVWSKANRMVQDWGAKILVIDYLQLMHLGRKNIRNRQEEMTEISIGLKAMAKDLKVPVIVISQLNRAPEKEKNRIPNMSDLRDTGAIEQDADVIGLLYNPKEDDEEDVADRSGFQAMDKAVSVILRLAKQRNGPTGNVPLIFLKAYTKFVSAPKLEQTDLPQPTNITPLDQPLPYKN